MFHCLYILFGGVDQDRKENLLLSQPNLKERGVIMDNNRVLLSNLKVYKKLERLLKIQRSLDNNKIIKEAKANNTKSESNTATNPIT